MSIVENKHIEKLLKRFFEGQTSNDEEQRLYEFFAGNDIPEHLIQYKPVFAYFNEGIKEELNETNSETPVLLSSSHDDIEEGIYVSETIFEQSAASLNSGIDRGLSEKEVPVRKIQSKKWILWSGVAAVILALILLNPFDKPFDPYEGSYIIRNGVRITDLKTIRPELESTVQQALQQQEEMDGLITRLTEPEKRFANVEKSMQENYDAILESFKDENVRNEVKKMLEKE